MEKSIQQNIRTRKRKNTEGRKMNKKKSWKCNCCDESFESKKELIEHLKDEAKRNRAEAEESVSDMEDVEWQLTDLKGEK